MIDKEDSALRTIGEVAEELNLPAHVLRFWETKFAQLKPNKRRGRHRYYRPEDIEKLKQIRHLLYEQGYTIKGAQKYLRTERKAGEPHQVDLFAYSPFADNNSSLSRLYSGDEASVPVEPMVSSAPDTLAPATRNATLGEQEVKRLKELLDEINRFKQLLRSDA